MTYWQMLGVVMFALPVLFLVAAAVHEAAQIAGWHDVLASMAVAGGAVLFLGTASGLVAGVIP